MRTKIHKKQTKGFGLLELMLSMVIVALLLIMATRYYSNAHTSARINDAVSQVGAIVAAANEYAIGNGSYDKIELTNIQALLPNHDTNSPWGTALQIDGTAKTSFKLTITTDEPDSCQLLASALGGGTGTTQATATCVKGSKDVVYIYNYVNP